MRDSPIRVNKIYYLQTLLEECKQEIKTNEIESLCNDNLSLSSSDESHNESCNKPDNESDNESYNDESKGRFGENYDCILILYVLVI